MSWSPVEAYNALPPLPPVRELETRSVLKGVIDARASLARLDAAASALPNPTVLINAIPLLEAQASSEIENIVTTTDELFTAAGSPDAPGISPAARESLRYRAALRHGFEQATARPVTAHTAAGVCSMIRGHDVEVRSGEVYIGDPTTRARVYTPPDNRGDIVRLLDNWAAYVNADLDVDPLVQMAVAHYQFEAIHPFSDGNGRTGRILNVLHLCSTGLLRLPVVYPSRAIIRSKDEYYRLLRVVTAEGAWEDWIRYMVRALRESSEQALELVTGIRGIEETLMDTVRGVIGVANRDLVAVLMEQPYARNRDVVDGCGVTRQTAGRWLKALVGHGALREHRVGREVLYINTEFMKALTQS